jgi:dTDP-glucose pyrophosphorylase
MVKILLLMMDGLCKMRKYLVREYCLIKDALKQMDITASKTLFVVNDKKQLIGAISDGDIRRAVLNGIPFDKPVKEIMNSKPLCFEKDYKLEKVKQILLGKKIEAVPIINNNKEVIEILFWDEIFREKKREYNQINLPVVIMAGGKGTRLDPFTRILPKPLIPIGDKPMIEVIMDEYAKYGMKNFYITINHKGKMVKAYFEDFKSDYSLQYINEDKPLGTAGALKYLEKKLNSPFFVSNCDIIIKDDYTKIYDFHKKGGYALTLVASMQNHVIPYGVCEIENGGTLTKIIEKPQYNFLVNAGMYILNPEVLEYIPKDEFYHITHLIEKLQTKGYKIGVYPVSEKSWIDVGQWSEYKNTIQKFKEYL